MYSTEIIPIHPLNANWLNGIKADVLRLDKIHPIVSGNKWFKLKYYITDAIAEDKNTIATFGGAYSNHIVATAYACKEAGLKSIGIIRGEKPLQLSHTLQDARAYGMELIYVSREEYRQKELLKDRYQEKWYWINEGGYGEKGMIGARDILNEQNSSQYTHILCACGTGTTLAGLIEASLPHQICIGVSALKGYTDLEKDVEALLPPQTITKRFKVMHDFHFGGYANHPQALLDWMNTLWREVHLPTDIVYTSKLLFAVKELVQAGSFAAEDKLLIIHSGGLQGNRSLEKGTLEFL